MEKTDSEIKSDVEILKKTEVYLVTAEIYLVQHL